MVKFKIIKKMIFFILVLTVLASCSDNKTTEPGESITPQEIEWCFVAAGEFTFGPPLGNNTYSSIEDITYDYEIMKYPVTNSQYVSYLNEAMLTGDVWVEGTNVKGLYPGDEWFEPGEHNLYTLGTELWGDNAARISYENDQFVINVPEGFKKGDFDNHPVVYIGWVGAWSYANFYGWYLPNEQEWEKAARGMSGFHYPWGNNIHPARANYLDSGDPWDQGTSPVGFYNGQNYLGFHTVDSPSQYGAYDMAGNVWEWIDNWYEDSGFFMYRVIKGGSWRYGINFLPSWYRSNKYPPHYRIGNIGFRCIRK